MGRNGKTSCAACGAEVSRRQSLAVPPPGKGQPAINAQKLPRVCRDGKGCHERMAAKSG